MPKTILVADDSVTIRKVVELTFRESGVRVETVAGGGDALDAIAKIRPDLVMADVVMPEPSGYEICRAVKSSERPVPVLLLAGTFEPFDADRARECGADGHVVKPFESRALLARVEELLSRPLAPAPSVDSTPRLRGEIEGALDELAAIETEAPETVAADAFAAPDVVEALLGPETSLEEVCAEEAPPAAPEPSDLPVTALSEPDVERIARAVVARLSDKVLREIAWEVVPDLAEAIIRERLRQIEQADTEPV